VSLNAVIVMHHDHEVLGDVSVQLDRVGSVLEREQEAGEGVFGPLFR
jgi:hypothetical protein